MKAVKAAVLPQAGDGGAVRCISETIVYVLELFQHARFLIVCCIYCVTRALEVDTEAQKGPNFADTMMWVATIHRALLRHSEVVVVFLEK